MAKLLILTEAQHLSGMVIEAISIINHRTTTREQQPPQPIAIELLKHLNKTVKMIEIELILTIELTTD